MRLPITAQMHDPECTKNCHLKQDVRQLTLAVSRAGRQQSAYFSGYICKRQPVGKYELDNCQETLRQLTIQQESEAVSDYVVKAQRTSRLDTDLYCRGMLRTSQEKGWSLRQYASSRRTLCTVLAYFHVWRPLW